MSVAKQENPKFLFVAKNPTGDKRLKTCPRATTLIARSQSLDTLVVIALSCKTWSCPYCGPRKMRALAVRVREAEPNKLVTLTINPALYENPRAAYDQSRRQVGELARSLRVELGEWEHLRVLETTKKGWPHYHLVVRAPFVAQWKLSQLWQRLSGARIVDIRQIKERDNVFSYVCKYLAKQTAVEWTKRRISWSKHFFKTPAHKQPLNLDLTAKTRSSERPELYIPWNQPDELWEQLLPGIWRRVSPGSPEWLTFHEEKDNAHDEA